MNSHRFLLSGLVAAGALLLAPLSALAESSVNQAFETAKSAVSPALQSRVVSIYGTGSPDSIQKWYIIFYDPNVASHGRAVIVANGQIAKTYAANGGVVYRSDLTFDPSRMTPEGPALAAAQGYAAKHHVVYDSVRALLKQAPGKPFRWRIELRSADQSAGYVYINALDSSVASFQPPGSSEPVAMTSTTSSFTTTTTTTSSSNANRPEDTGDKDDDFGDHVKNTFLGIGGDLQEFFTGQRTVDK